jgi:putative transposase
VKGVDKLEVDEERWREATGRAAVKRPLIAKDSIEPQAIHDACRKLGVRRTRLYELIEQFRASPVVSSLVARRRGPKEGSSRLAPAHDQLIDDAIKEFYRTRQKPNVNALRRHVRPLCRVRGARPPSWDAIKARVARTDERLLLQDREGAEAARARFAPVVGNGRRRRTRLACGRSANGFFHAYPVCCQIRPPDLFSGHGDARLSRFPA